MSTTSDDNRPHETDTATATTTVVIAFCGILGLCWLVIHLLGLV